MKLILGSTSPRRKEILSYFNIPFEQRSPPFDEDTIAFTGDPERYVLAIAMGKAESLNVPDHVILTADTAVYFNGKIYEKPKDGADAFAMLSELVGHTHTVYTGVVAKSPTKRASAVSATKVTFESLTPHQIRIYQKRINGLDKAGGYAIQGAGSLIVKQIEGCYTNVVGLPVQEVASVLHSVGIDLWYAS